MKLTNKIPMPQYGHSKYPLNIMEVGDSFEIPTEKESLLVRSSISMSKKRGVLKGKFTVRKYEGKYRCWKVSE